jgi:hypothetical protein
VKKRRHDTGRTKQRRWSAQILALASGDGCAAVTASAGMAFTYELVCEPRFPAY